LFQGIRTTSSPYRLEMIAFMEVEEGHGEEQPCLEIPEVKPKRFNTTASMLTLLVACGAVAFWAVQTKVPGASRTTLANPIVMAEVDPAEAAKLMRSGTSTYKELQINMNDGLGLGQYLWQLQNITELMAEIDMYLNQQEKTAGQKINDAKMATDEAMLHADIVIASIKMQSEAMLTVLNSLDSLRSVRAKTACEVFVAFSKTTQQSVDTALHKVRVAKDKLGRSITSVPTVVQALGRIRQEMEANISQTPADERTPCFGGGSVLPPYFGPLGLASGPGIAAGICDGATVPSVNGEYKGRKSELEGFQAHLEGTKPENTHNTEQQVENMKLQLVEVEKKLDCVQGWAAAAPDPNSNPDPVDDLDGLRGDLETLIAGSRISFESLMTPWARCTDGHHGLSGESGSALCRMY